MTLLWIYSYIFVTLKQAGCHPFMRVIMSITGGFFFLLWLLKSKLRSHVVQKSSSNTHYGSVINWFIYWIVNMLLRNAKVQIIPLFGSNARTTTVPCDITKGTPKLAAITQVRGILRESQTLSVSPLEGTTLYKLPWGGSFCTSACYFFDWRLILHIYSARVQQVKSKS